MTKTHTEFLEELKKYLLYKLKSKERGEINTPLSAGVKYLAEILLQKIEQFETEQNVNNQ